MVSTAVDPSQVASAVGIATAFKQLRENGTAILPQRVAVIGQGASASTYSNTKAQYFSAFAVGEAYGFGSPVHLAAKQLLPSNGDGLGTVPMTIYPLDDDVSGVAAAGDITPSGAATGSATFVVKISEIKSARFNVTSGDTVSDIIDAMAAAVAANVDMPMIGTDNTTVFDLAAKWQGSSANDLVIEVEAIGTDSSGVTFAITQPTGGANNPDITTALDQIGNVWETCLVSCFEHSDTTILDAFNAYNEGEWAALIHQPCYVLYGNTPQSVSNGIATTNVRPLDRTNYIVPSPKSKELPLAIAARAASRIAVSANNNPAKGYRRLPLTGLVPGADAEQWSTTQRDAAVKGGSGTTEVRDNVMVLSDVTGMFKPTGDPTPAWRYLVTTVKRQQVLYNLTLIFDSLEWASAPLLPAGQATTNPTAKSPTAAIAEISQLIDNLALQAILSNPEAAKATIASAIDGVNSNRLNASLTDQVSGNVEIISIDSNFGFFNDIANLV